MRKVVIRMRGGLGNQLFQLAYGLYINKCAPSKVDILLDIREYRTNKIREFELYQYKQGEKLSLYKEKSLYYDITRWIWHLIGYIYKKIKGKELESNCFFLQVLGLYYTTHLVYPLKYYSKRKTCYIYGYFQDVRMVDLVREEMLDFIHSYQEISEQAEFLLNKIKKEEHCVAVSMRLGDDFEKAGQPISAKSFYKEGLKKVIRNSSHIYVFSDEVERAKQYDFDVDNEIIYVTNLNAYEQLLLMGECSDFVIANSSFAWWGAYISENKSKAIVVPAVWMNGVATINDTRYYKNMVIIENT